MREWPVRSHQQGYHHARSSDTEAPQTTRRARLLTSESSSGTTSFALGQYAERPFLCLCGGGTRE